MPNANVPSSHIASFSKGVRRIVRISITLCYKCNLHEMQISYKNNGIKCNTESPDDNFFPEVFFRNPINCTRGSNGL